jgi:predicted Zn-dependent peptidase
MFPQNDYAIKHILQVHYNELLDEAESNRMAKQALLNKAASRSRSPNILASIGRRLLKWGARLDQDYPAKPSKLAEQGK